MDWQGKFNVVQACLRTNKAIEQDFYIKTCGASDEVLARVRSDFPFVSDDYMQFLQLTDGADIAQCRFVEGTRIPSLIGVHGETYSSDYWLPFGYEAGGDPLLLDECGKVAIGNGKSSAGDFQFLADSFSDFLYRVIMGQNYGAIFRVAEDERAGFYRDEIVEDPWLAFLVERGWLQIQ